MLQSMTGYGEATLENDTFYLHATIKTLNSKYLDIQFNLPKIFISQEATWRKLFSQHLQRGNITLDITYLHKELPIKTLINEPLLKTCYHTLNDIAKELGTQTDLLACALRTIKNTTANKPPTPSPNHLLQVQETIKKALAKCTESRQKEANQLQAQIRTCLDILLRQLTQIDAHTPQRNLALRTKLNEKITLRETSSTLDPHRWEQEILYYLEKLDIEEEKVRLKSHLTYFEQTLNKQSPIGKKLNFIAQEIGRELNTIASKAQDSILQHLVIDMKQALEQIKEQVQNLV